MPPDESRFQCERSGVAERGKSQVVVGAATGTIVVLKGAGTVVAMPDGQVHVNSTGNPGMASGGMGDVLTGIIAGLITQGYSPERAAVIGVYLHGAAAEFAVEATLGRTLDRDSV